MGTWEGVLSIDTAFKGSLWKGSPDDSLRYFEKTKRKKCFCTMARCDDQWGSV